MKKLTIILMIGAFSITAARSQDLLSKRERAPESRNENSSGNSDVVPVTAIKSEDVDIITKNNFKSDFINPINVQWNKWSAFDMVSFTLNGKNMKAYYDPQGDLIGTTQDKSFTDLPAKAQQEISTEYKNYKIGPITYYNDNEYDIELRDIYMVYGLAKSEDSSAYFAELSNGSSRIVVQITPVGEVSLFKILS